MKRSSIEALLDRGSVYLAEELEWIAELKRFREDRSSAKKMAAVEAILWDGKENQQTAWIQELTAAGTITFERDSQGVVTMRISTKDGPLRAHSGDYLILGLNKDLYVCPANVFTSRYEPA